MNYETFKQNSITVEATLLDVCSTIRETILPLMDEGLKLVDNVDNETPEVLRAKAVKYFKQRSEAEDRLVNDNREIGLMLSKYSLEQSMEGSISHGERLQKECPGLQDRILNLVNTFQQLNAGTMEHPLSGKVSAIAKYL